MDRASHLAAVEALERRLKQADDLKAEILPTKHLLLRSLPNLALSDGKQKGQGVNASQYDSAACGQTIRLTHKCCKHLKYPPPDFVSRSVKFTTRGTSVLATCM